MDDNIAKVAIAVTKKVYKIVPMPAVSKNYKNSMCDSYLALKKANEKLINDTATRHRNLTEKVLSFNRGQGSFIHSVVKYTFTTFKWSVILVAMPRIFFSWCCLLCMFMWDVYMNQCSHMRKYVPPYNF